MPRSTKEWIGKSDDTQAPPKVRLRVFDAHKGICFLSGIKINAGDKWELHHIKGLIEGGENRESNLAPVLPEHHKAETKRQKAEKKIINRKRSKHIGAAAETKNPIKSAGFAKTSKKPKTPVNTLPRRNIFSGGTIR